MGKKDSMCHSSGRTDRFFEQKTMSEGLPSISFATRLLHPPKAVEDPYGASSPPIYQTATFAQVDPCEVTSEVFYTIIKLPETAQF